MRGKKGNSLIVIENGQLSTYMLDDKLVWEVGRPSKDNLPDIRLYSATISRHHGRFQNIDGMWFYLDKKGKNGTVYNGKHITVGIRGRFKPIPMKDKDVLIFGGGEEPLISIKTVWAMFSEHIYDERWRVEDTKGLSKIQFSEDDDITVLDHPQKGTIIEKDNGIAIYMGDITYLSGDITVSSGDS